MQRRWLGNGALSVPVLTLGTASFAPGAWSDSNASRARALVDLCLDAGLNMFDTADVYSDGNAERILGRAIAGRRSKVLIATKAGLRSGSGTHDVGTSRAHLLAAVDGSLRRLDTDYIDLFQLHAFDAMTPIEETLQALDELVRAGKLRQVGVSNFAGWQLMKSLDMAERHGWPRYVAHQVYYSLIGRDYEWELMPLGLDQRVSALVWSPLGWGRLRPGIQAADAGRHRGPAPAYAPPAHEPTLARVLDALACVARDTGKSETQIALNWLLQRPTVASLVIGVSGESQLLHNLGAVDWDLDAAHVRLLDDASAAPAAYPHWHQRAFPERNPSPLAHDALRSGSASRMSSPP